jgi:lysine 2,3-aminomutase
MSEVWYMENPQGQGVAGGAYHAASHGPASNPARSRGAERVAEPRAGSGTAEDVEAPPSEDGPSRDGASVGRSEILDARPDLASIWASADAVFPVRVTRSFWDRVRADDPDDPLARQVLPDPAELVAADDDLADPVGDDARSPVPWVVHKYPDRVLLLVTKRCHLYCRYCFRRTHAPEDRLDPTPEAWEAAVRYATTCGAREVILSGGDPLILPDAKLLGLLDTLRAAPDVRRVRVHTRAPITAPARVTAALAEGLAARGPAWVVVHCNHPRELAPDVDAALARLVDAGVFVLNQAVLLRGVNDDPDTLATLFEALVDRGVRPYYLHATDRVAGNAHLRVDPAEGLAIYEAAIAMTSGLARPRFVIDPPDGGGKVDVARWLQAQAGGAGR